MSYLLPFDRSIRRSQDFGANPGWGPNPPGGHNGDDWATPAGTPVRAAGDGEVVFAGEFDDTYADNFGWNLHYGGLMVILNMDGETAPYFEYGHNSKLLVKAGERVVRGQVIALTGNTDGGTGISTGPHCHVGCLPHNFDLGSSTYGRVNPRLYMTEYPDAGALSYASSESIKVPQEDELSAQFEADARGEFDGLRLFQADVRGELDKLRALDIDLRGDLANKGQQLAALTAANGKLVELLADSKGLSVDDIKQALTAAIADGIKVTVEAK